MGGCCFSKTEDHDYPNNADWMRDLRNDLHKKHLNEIAIPGSHDSFAYNLDKTAPLAPDIIKGSTIEKLARALRSPAKKVIWKWSLTQRLNFNEQLNAGIRYFDLRVSTRPSTANSDGVDDLYLVHGLYGPRLEDILREINTFLGQHSKEVVFLDLNHFYRMSAQDHEKCIRYITDIFGDRLCPFVPDSITLDWMWSSSYQVIVFYHQKDKVKDTVESKSLNILWDGNYMASPWHNVAKSDKLIQRLDTHYNEKYQGYQNIHPPALYNDGKFHVTQGILTPDAKLIITRAGSSLKKHCGKAASQPFVQWLKTKEAGGVNICIMDFVEMEDFINTVIKLNDKTSSEKVVDRNASVLRVNDPNLGIKLKE